MNQATYLHPRIKSTLLFLLVSLCIGIISQASQHAPHHRKLNKHQHKAIERTQQLKEALVWEVMEKEIVFKFPDQVKTQNITGSVHFSNIRHQDLNKTYYFSPGTGLGRCISTEWLKKGDYTVQVNWKADNQEYYSEGLLSLN